MNTGERVDNQQYTLLLYHAEYFEVGLAYWPLRRPPAYAGRGYGRAGAIRKYALRNSEQLSNEVDV